MNDIKCKIIQKGLVVGIILLFIGAVFTSSIADVIEDFEKNNNLFDKDEIFKVEKHYIGNLIRQELENRVISNNFKWEQDKLLASDGTTGDQFGWSISIDSNYAIIGTPYDNDNGQLSGSAYIFIRTDLVWTQQAKIFASDGANGSFFGISVSIDGDYVIIGANHDDDNGDNSGSAYIFKRDGNNWIEQDKLLASDGEEMDFFGGSVSIDGDYAVIGADRDDDNGDYSGSAYIFKRDGTDWIEEDKLLPSDGALMDQFGWSVSIHNDYVIIGSPYDDDNGDLSGSAYIFKRDGTTWTQHKKLLASDGEIDDCFGYSVALDSDFAIIGAVDDNDNGFKSGSAYIFKRDGTDWIEKDKLLASDGAEDDNFGWCVSIDSNYAIIGVPHDDDNGDYSGSAYVFITSPPTIEVISPEQNEGIKGIVTIQGTANTYFGTLELVQIKIDDGEWEDAIGTNTWSYEWDTDDITEDQYIINARSQDDSGLYSSIASVTVIVDRTPPDLNIIYPDAGYIYVLGGLVPLPIVIEKLKNNNAIISQGGFTRQIRIQATDNGSGINSSSGYAYIDKDPRQIHWELIENPIKEFVTPMLTRGFYINANLIVRLSDNTGNVCETSIGLAVYTNILPP